MLHGTNELAVMGGMPQEAEATALGRATASQENRGPGTSRKTTPEDRGLPRLPPLRPGAADEVGRQPANTTAVPTELSTHTPKPTTARTAGTSLSPIYEGEGVNSPQTSRQMAPNAEGCSSPPAPDSSSGATDLGLHHTADPAVPPADRNSMCGLSTAAVLALAGLAAPRVGGMGGPKGTPSVLGPMGLLGFTHSRKAAYGGTQTSMATVGTAGMAWMGTIAAGMRFYRFIG